MKSVYIVDALRTPVGSYLGQLSSIPAVQLGAHVIKSLVRKHSIPEDRVDQVIMGMVLSGGVGQAPARQATILSGLDPRTPTYTVNKVCGSGLHAIVLAWREILFGGAHLVIAGGMENMSQAPHGINGMRGGIKMGDISAKDLMIHDGLWDVYNDKHMGYLADRVAREQEVTREEQDDYAVRSYRLAIEANESGKFADEIVPVEVKLRKKTFTMERDEGPFVFNEEKMRRLSPAFVKDDTGSVTAGNASSLNDGAAAVLVADEEAVKQFGLTPRAKLVSYGVNALESKYFTMAPVGAMEKALASADLKPDKVEWWEVNEAFAPVPIYAKRAFDLPLDLINPRGGSIAIGHPIGASGARVFTTAFHGMLQEDRRNAMISLCIGGGEGNALLIERV